MTNITFANIGTGPVITTGIPDNLLEQKDPQLNRKDSNVTNIFQKLHARQISGRSPPQSKIVIQEELKWVTLEELKEGGRKLAFQNTLKLDLQESKVTDKDLEDIVKKFANITEINATDCPAITDAGLAHLRNLHRLKSLNLEFTGITDDGLVHLHNLTALSSLNLAGTDITDEGLVHLSHLTTLESLNLGYNTEITDEGLVHLSHLISLKSLNLGYNTEITDEGLVHLSHLISLKSLNLAGTDITDEGLVHLSNLTALENLNLGGGCQGITNNGMRLLVQTLSRLRIDL